MGYSNRPSIGEVHGVTGAAEDLPLGKGLGTMSLSRPTAGE
ncbi:hypothetical protein SAMN04487819_101394 [Actinopolyspora alba]|uniref:Uncharacterized protein n=1 Tax=Actinopolyspora alba TaxID=673379 RepID=A0A1I1TW09_9ACTN|nr:hypothetical protein SAMN04487819_101394 [Actinopolyspora alba]